MHEHSYIPHNSHNKVTGYLTPQGIKQIVRDHNGNVKDIIVETLNKLNSGINADTLTGMTYTQLLNSVMWDITHGSFTFSGQIISSINTGTAPFIINSTTLVNNLNAELWQGHTWSEISDLNDETDPVFTAWLATSPIPTTLLQLDDDSSHRVVTDIQIAYWDAKQPAGAYVTGTPWTSMGYLTSQISHADVIIDGDFSSEGLMRRGASAGIYTIVGDNSSDWNTAFSWGNHAIQGYLTVVSPHALLSTHHSDTLADNVERGDIIYGNSTPKWARLVKGSNGQVLGADNDDIKWIDIPSSMVYPDAGLVLSTGSAWSTPVTNNSNNWNTAFSWGNHASAGYLTTQTSHADVLVDGDFTSIGLMKRGTNAGEYSIIIDNSSNWNTAYGWGNHASAGYVTGTPWTGLGYLTGVVVDSPLSGAGTSVSHLTVDLSGKQNASTSLSSLAGLVYASTAFVKLTGADTFTLDTNTYLTSLSGAVLTDRNLTINGTTYDLSVDRSWTVGDMILASAQSVTGAKTFDKDMLLMKGTSTGKNTVSVANTSGTDYTNIIPAKAGTFAMTSDITGTNSGTNTGDDRTAVTGFLKGNGSTISASTINPDDIATDSLEPTGFTLPLNWGLATVSIVSTTKLKISVPTTSGNIVWYWRGVKHTIASPIEATSTADKAEGIWFCYSTDGTNFILTQDAFQINYVVTGALRNDLMLYEFYWDNTNNTTLWIQPEYHGYIMDGRTHYHLHETYGTRYITGFDVTYGTLPASTDVDKRIKFVNGEVHDEDISAFITHNASPSATWQQILGSVGTADSNYAQLPIYYRSGASASNIWRKVTATSYPFSPITNNVAFNYNRLNTGSYDYTSASGINNYWNAFIVATTNQSEPVVVIAGRVVSNTLATVTAENLPNLGTEGLFTEYKLLYRLIYRNSSTTAGKATLISVTDYRLDSLSGITSQTTNIIASAVGFSPAGNIAATNVQTALEELDTEKQVAGSYPTSAEIIIIKQLTAAEYAALTPKVSTTMYVIIG